MFPHERSLVKRLSGQPFAIVGVNSDRGRERVKESNQEEQITWRNWWDGGNTRGPIATTWNVSSWPAIYVLDDKGVIRFKNVRGKELDQAIDTLLEEFEQAAAN